MGSWIENFIIIINNKMSKEIIIGLIVILSVCGVFLYLSITDKWIFSNKVCPECGCTECDTAWNESRCISSFGDALMNYYVPRCSGADSSLYEFIGDRMGPGDRLGQCQGLMSSDEAYMLVMQSNGDCVVYNRTSNEGVWNAGTRGSGNFLVYQEDGDVVILNYQDAVLWSAGQAGDPVGELVMQTDGNLVTYGDGSAQWATGTQGL
jgi:hypothetical protein